jgi:hypothetical protein
VLFLQERDLQALKAGEAMPIIEPNSLNANLHPSSHVMDLYKNNDKTEFLHEIFKDLAIDEFRFPTTGLDGCIGRSNCISKAYIPPAKSGSLPLAFHLNFTCVPTSFRGAELNLKITQFHLTARRSTAQKLINNNGPSILTAADSIHISRTTEWGRPNNMKSLVQALDKSEADLRAVLRKEGFDKAFMEFTVFHAKKQMTERVSRNLGTPIEITWNDSDVTFEATGTNEEE